MRLEGSTSRLNDIQFIGKISKRVARECCQIPKTFFKQSFQNSKQEHSINLEGRQGKVIFH
jgi:hypothetical protein